MRTLITDAAPEARGPDAADRFRERMARAGAPDPGRARRRTPEERKGGLKLGWKSWLLIDGTGLILFLTVIVVWPPLSACRTKALETGFYTGDSVETCTRRGVVERLDRADQRIKMMVRGSGT